MKLTLISNADCKVYVDTELHGTAAFGVPYCINLPKGAYYIECVSDDKWADRVEFDLRTDGVLDAERIVEFELRYMRFLIQRGVHCNRIVKYNDDNVIIVVGDKYGLYNLRQEAITIPAKYQKIWSCSPEYAIIQQNGRCGILNSAGEKITPVKYARIYRFSEGRARVTLNGKCGFIGLQGNEVVP